MAGHVKGDRIAVVHLILDLACRFRYSGSLSAKNISNWEWISPQSFRRPVHFLVISAMAKYSIFRRLSSVGKTDFALVTFRSWWLKFSMELVV